jgi:hypothetical protein
MMSRGRPAEGSVGLPYVYVKLSSRPNAPAKKVLIPKSMPDFRAAAAKALKVDDPIFTFYDANGGLVNDIRQLHPGGVYVVAVGARNQPSQARPSQKVSRIPSRQRTPAAPVRKSPVRDRSPDVSYSITEDEPEPLPPKPSPQRSPIRPQKEEPPSDVPGVSEVPESETEPHETGSIQNLFNEAFVSPVSGFAVDEILGQFPSSFSSFLVNCGRLEREQRNHWFHSLTTLISETGIIPDCDVMLGEADMNQKALNIIQEHILASPIGYSLLFNLVITGPARSGKTAFLSIMIQKLLQVLAACNCWKRTFLIVLNGDHLALAGNTAKSLYVKLVQVVIPFAIAQIPVLVPYAKMLQRYFEAIPDLTYLPLLPKRFIDAPQTQRAAKACMTAAQSLSAAWNDTENPAGVFVAIAFFPILLGKELGFEDVIVVLDNIDTLTFPVNPGPQFPQGSDILASESFKKALKTVQFILSYRDAEDFENFLKPINRSVETFSASLEYHSVIDLVTDEKYANSEVTVKIRNEQLKLMSPCFGNAPGFLRKWHTLNELMNDVEEAELGTDQWAEAFALAVNETQGILSLLFERGEPFGEIDDLSRKIDTPPDSTSNHD